jgi:hypothetical protein
MGHELQGAKDRIEEVAGEIRSTDGYIEALRHKQRKENLRSRLLEALIAEHGTPEMKAAVSSQLSCSISSLLLLLEFFPIPLHQN